MKQEPTFNQYAAPQAVVDDVGATTEMGQLKMFSAEGRIGRLRFLAYAIGGGWLIKALSAVLMAIFIGVSPQLVGIISALTWAPILWFVIISGIKRAHDFNASGWWSLVSLIPLLGILIWIVIPGSKGCNRYGPPPPANTWGVRVMSLLLPIMVIGILAAVAIPQYKAYTDRARAAAAAQQPRN